MDSQIPRSDSCSRGGKGGGAIVGIITQVKKNLGPGENQVLVELKDDFQSSEV